MGLTVRELEAEHHRPLPPGERGDGAQLHLDGAQGDGERCPIGELPAPEHGAARGPQIVRPSGTSDPLLFKATLG